MGIQDKDTYWIKCAQCGRWFTKIMTNAEYDITASYYCCTNCEDDALRGD